MHVCELHIYLSSCSVPFIPPFYSVHRLVTTGVTRHKCKWFPPVHCQPLRWPQSQFIDFEKLLSPNSWWETQSFTTGPSSILSGFKWIKGKIKQWKAIKRFLKVTLATSVFQLTLHHVNWIWGGLIEKWCVYVCAHMSMFSLVPRGWDKRNMDSDFY